MKDYIIGIFFIAAGDNFKNGACLKNLTSRRNFLALKRMSLFFALCLSFMITTSCDKDDKKGDGRFTRMNIEDAKTLFIASTESGSKMYGIKKSSLKSTSEMDGEIYEICYLDANGKQIEKNNPSRIIDAGDFLIVEFTDWHTSEAYFVKKSDGLIYEIPQEYRAIGSNGRYFSFSRNVQHDIHKNIYYRNVYWGSTLYKVSSIASSAIQFTEVSAVNDNVTGFCVDAEGQIIYTHRRENEAYEENMRFRRVDGSFVNMTIYDYDTGDNILRIWTGMDGIIYGFVRNLNEIMGSNSLVKIQDRQIVKIKPVSQFYAGEPSHTTYWIQGRIICCVPSSAYPTMCYLIDISSESLYKETQCWVRPNMVINDQLCHFDDKTFSCTIINIDTGETSSLYDLDESRLSNYDIDKIISVSDSGVVFSAVRLSDGNYVVAKIGLDNSVTIQQTIEGNVLVIMPLNLSSFF